MAVVLTWVALSGASVGLVAVALVPSLTGRMWRTDTVELRRFLLFRQVLTDNLCARVRADADAGTEVSPAHVRPSRPARTPARVYVPAPASAARPAPVPVPDRG
ncbi:hypothetical protein [Actinacidiphila acididurans]|uniref:Uncharacterized protein n=1 Tax=Actinacidiphila acididurans TaxID=2784346 RepID=A0ABS2U1X9_9ACTN|nr:hypothetical protein [Actinacidiphila acididurans]MBM9509590.1 hypothetical protein [Actinacidiphila acididurans]